MKTQSEFSVFSFHCLFPFYSGICFRKAFQCHLCVVTFLNGSFRLLQLENRASKFSLLVAAYQLTKLPRRNCSENKEKRWVYLLQLPAAIVVNFILKRNYHYSYMFVAQRTAMQLREVVCGFI